MTNLRTATSYEIEFSDLAIGMNLWTLFGWSSIITDIVRIGPDVWVVHETDDACWSTPAGVTYVESGFHNSTTRIRIEIR